MRNGEDLSIDIESDKKDISKYIIKMDIEYDVGDKNTSSSVGRQKEMQK